MTAPADARARRALRAAGLDPDTSLRRAPSNANEAWVGDDFVLRVNFRGDIGRLGREARVALALPAEARYPGMLAYGTDGQIEWIVSRLVPGSELSRVWPDLTSAERERAARDLAGVLRALHGTTGGDLPGDRDLAGPHVLPLDRLEDQLRRVRALPHIDAGMMDEVLAFVRARWEAFDEWGRGLVHGDPHLENVLWHDGEITALLDLEWSRRSWIEVDLEILLSFCDDPAWFVSEDYEHLALPAHYTGVPGWLRNEYLEWFAHPLLLDRLVVLDISRQLGHYEDSPPRAPRDPSNPRDRRNHIAALLDGTSHLHRLLS